LKDVVVVDWGEWQDLDDHDGDVDPVDPAFPEVGGAVLKQTIHCNIQNEIDEEVYFVDFVEDEVGVGLLGVSIYMGMSFD
jgi:hypothetical protein